MYVEVGYLETLRRCPECNSEPVAIGRHPEGLGYLWTVTCLECMHEAEGESEHAVAYCWNRIGRPECN